MEGKELQPVQTEELLEMWLKPFRQQYEDFTSVLLEWLDSEEFLTLYLALQDLELVEPIYDPASTCETVEDEWEVFDH